MRRSHLLLALPLALEAAPPRRPKPLPPPRLILREAQVVTGAGREPLPGQPMPASTFHAQVTSAHLPTDATFRVWKLPTKSLPRLAKGTPVQQLGGVAVPVEEPRRIGDTVDLRGTWPGNVADDDRVVVEAWKGPKRLAWAQGPVVELLRPQRPAPDSEN